MGAYPAEGITIVIRVFRPVIISTSLSLKIKDALKKLSKEVSIVILFFNSSLNSLYSSTNLWSLGFLLKFKACLFCFNAFSFASISCIFSLFYSTICK